MRNYVIGNQRKGGPCYKVAKNMAELYVENKILK